MGNRRKKEFLMCSIAEIKMIEERFEKMASKGWLIDKANALSYEYKKTEPKELQFSIDILPQITAFDYPHNEDAEEYRRMCQESGWTFAAASKQIQIFYTEKKNCMPLPIHTDDKIKSQIMMKTCIKYELFPITIALLALLYVAGMLIKNGYSIFLLNTSIAQAIAFALFIPTTLWYLIFVLVWYFKNSLYVKKDFPKPKVNYKLAKWRRLSYGISAIFAVVIMFTGIIFDIFGGAPTVIFITPIIPVISFAIGLFIRNQIDTKKREKKTNVKIAVTGIIAAGVLSSIMTIFIIHSLGSGMSDRLTLPENRLALKLEDFGISYNTDLYANYFSTDTIAFPLNYTYYETTKKGSVRTDVKKSVSKFLAQKLFQELHKKLNNYEWRSLTEMTADELVTWGATKGYYTKPEKTEVLLLYEKTIVQASFDSEEISVRDVQEKIKLYYFF